MTSEQTKRAIVRAEWMAASAIMMLNACTAMLVYQAGVFTWGWPPAHPIVIICFGWFANAMGLRPGATLRDPLPHLDGFANARRALVDMVFAVLMRTIAAAGLCAVAYGAPS